MQCIDCFVGSVYNNASGKTNQARRDKVNVKTG